MRIGVAVEIETDFVEKLRSLKYEYRPDIRDRDTLQKNFREKFEALNRVQLTESEFQRLLEEIITPDVFAAARILRERQGFTRDDGTPLNYTLVNIKAASVANDVDHRRSPRSSLTAARNILGSPVIKKIISAPVL